MESVTRGSLETIAGQLAVIAGAVHLGMATYYVTGGRSLPSGDLRLLLWAVTGTALVVGAVVAAAGRYQRRIQAAGFVGVGLLLVAHFGWPAMTGEQFYLGATPGVGGAATFLRAQLLDVHVVARVLVWVELALFVALFSLLVDKGPR